MKLFIDTNVLLSFYHLTSEDIEELKKLIALIDKKKIELLMPSQVLDEFYRNREGKIMDALRRFKEAKFSISFPAFCKAYKQYDELCGLIKNADAKHAELLDEITSDASGSTLEADTIIEEIFKKAEMIEVTKEIHASAAKRIDLGNPPGKKGSLGDAINWECLLSAVQNDDETDVYIISGDIDYASPLVDDINPFLEREWDKEKKSCVYLYRKLSNFFKDKYPAIKLADEREKDRAILELAKSRSFADTHVAIAELQKHTSFNPPQVELLASIPEANNQVGWITSDPDVSKFYRLVFDDHKDQIDEKTRAKLESIVKSAEPSGD